MTDGSDNTPPSAPADHPWEAKARDLPASPGVYIFKDGTGVALYVGKAKNLRARVRAYTREGGDTRFHVQFLRERVRDLDYVITDTEKEALILENNLIKKHRPRYNIRLRDDKTFYHARLTLSDEFPRLTLTRRPKKGGADLLFGPFSSSAKVKETIRAALEIFPLRRCKSPRLRLRDRPCLNHQIGKCAGPCARKVSREDYQKLVDQVARFLKGGLPELIFELTKQMEEAAEALDFERAAELRDRVNAIRDTLESQKVDSVKPLDRDVIGFFREGDRVALHRLGYRSGALLVSDSYGFSRVTLPDEEILSSFLAQLYPERDVPPPDILLPFPLPDREVIEEALAESRGKKVRLIRPERGEGKKLVEMANANARETLKRESERGDDRARAMEELRSRLNLGVIPRWIECVDISLTAGESAVGSVVKFMDGEPDKSGYRRYQIKTVEGVNDYDMMREVLRRRFSRSLAEGKPLPDLLVVDGGKGQLGVALAVEKDLSLPGPPVAALAKDRETGDPRSAELVKKGERVFVPGRKDPVLIKPGTAALFLLQRVRDEAHRFAISYHKKLRGKKLRRSRLEDVPGIGPKKAKALVKHFGGMSGVRQAGEEKLTEVVSRADAQNIVRHFNAESEIN